MKKLLTTTAMLGLAFTMQAQVRLNQVGLPPQQEKVATVEGVVKASQVKILDAFDYDLEGREVFENEFA